jgi:hypothetical protein
MKKFKTGGKTSWTVGELLDGIKESPASYRIVNGEKRARFVVIADGIVREFKTIKSLEKDIANISSDRVEVCKNWYHGISIVFDI